MSDRSSRVAEQRHFSRILFRAAGRLRAADLTERCEVRDLSLKGALLTVEHPSAWPVGIQVQLDIALDAEGHANIRMTGSVAHHAGTVIGMRCSEIDLDSITHLRRLVELNLGIEAILQRELAALSTN